MDKSGIKLPHSMVPCTAASILPPAPQLPDFHTLLVQWDYPPSIPFHLCLSHMSRSCNTQHSPRPIIISAMSRSNVIQGLADFNDGWLVTNAGLGATAALLSRIRILCVTQPRSNIVIDGQPRPLQLSCHSRPLGFPFLPFPDWRSQ